MDTRTREVCEWVCGRTMKCKSSPDCTLGTGLLARELMVCPTTPKLPRKRPAITPGTVRAPSELAGFFLLVCPTFQADYFSHHHSGCIGRVPGVHHSSCGFPSD